MEGEQRTKGRESEEKKKGILNKGSYSNCSLYIM